MLSFMTLAVGLHASRPALHAPRPLRASRAGACVAMSGKVVVTDGTDSFYGSRTIFQMLHDYGDYSAIIASSSCVSDAKKMLLSRTARYSGLLDLLTFNEGDISEAFAGADTWVSMNSDGGALTAQVAAAKAAGVKRIFLHFSSEGPTDVPDDALESALDGVTYTVMRTGALMAGGSGGGLKLGSVSEPTCAELCKEDVYRILAEAITLDSAYGRMFSLCPSEDVAQFKEMRMAGCGRREEADALLKGMIKEKEPDPEASPEEAAAKAEEVAVSEAEQEAKREEELKMLIERARVRGQETAEREAKEEEEKQKLRAERNAYFAQLEPKEDKDGEDGDSPPPPPADPPSPPPDDKKDDDDDGLALA